MSGCRSLTKEETDKVLSCLKNPRDKLLFIMGIRTGFRISELLTLQVGNIWDDLGALARIKVQRKNMKGKLVSREIVLHPQVKEYLPALCEYKPDDEWLFPSRNHGRHLSRYQAHDILKAAYEAAGVRGHVATHTMRKTFAQRVYKNTEHDLVATQVALGHRSILNTIKYLSTDTEKVDKAILKDD